MVCLKKMIVLHNRGQMIAAHEPPNKQERKGLYSKVSLPMDPIPINIETFVIDDELLDEAAIMEVARELCNGRDGGPIWIMSI